MKYLAILFLISFRLISCGGYNEVVLLKADNGFIKFVGNTNAISIVIDDGKEMLLNNEIDVYQVSPGKHKVEIFRNSQLLVKRTVIIDTQTTMEIQIP